MLADFKNSFAVGLGLSSKFATRLVPYFPSQLNVTLRNTKLMINNSNVLDVFYTIS